MSSRSFSEPQLSSAATESTMFFGVNSPSPFTMLFTPFKDKRLLKLLECSNSVIVNQVTDGKLSKMVIEHLNKDLLPLLDTSKNSNDPHWFWQ